MFLCVFTYHYISLHVPTPFQCTSSNYSAAQIYRTSFPTQHSRRLVLSLMHASSARSPASPPSGFSPHTSMPMIRAAHLCRRIIGINGQRGSHPGLSQGMSPPDPSSSWRLSLPAHPYPQRYTMDAGGTVYSGHPFCRKAFPRCLDPPCPCC